MHKLIRLFIASTILTSGLLMAGDIVGKITSKGVRDSRNVVVYIEKVANPEPVPEEHAMMDQVNMEYVPHVLPIIKGTTVDFRNSDDVLHNVFTPDKCAGKMNLGTWQKGEIRSYTFKEEGCESVVLCNVHPEMEAWVLVLQNQYFLKTDKDGVYKIEGVPAGKYTLKVWHEKLKNQSAKIEVPEDGEVEVNFTLKRR